MLLVLGFRLLWLLFLVFLPVCFSVFGLLFWLFLFLVHHEWQIGGIVLLVLGDFILFWVFVFHFLLVAIMSCNVQILHKFFLLG